jgi:hypothetical protein
VVLNKRELDSYDTNRPIDWFDSESMFGIKNNNITIQKEWKLFSITWKTYNSYYRDKNLSITIKLKAKIQRKIKFVENKGVEPLTPCLQSRCSSQLS